MVTHSSLFFISGDSNKDTYTPLFVAGYNATSSYENDVKSLEIKIMGTGIKSSVRVLGHLGETILAQPDSCSGASTK